MLKKIFFWQPEISYYNLLSKSAFGKIILVSSNYLSWIYFFAVSLILVRSNASIFFQLLIAMVISETIEKYLKNLNFWPRPSFLSQDINKVPKGLIKSWYIKGSFPSGHSMKAIIFYLLIVQHQPFLINSFFLFPFPLLIFRVLTGFHYPIDIVAGLFFGFIIWFLTHNLIFPQAMNLFVQHIINTIFFLQI